MLTATDIGEERIHRTAPELPALGCGPQWYAAYTSANHEKRVADQLCSRQVEHFVALYETARQWKDRKVKLQMPLFPGYVFVRIALRDRLQVVQTPGVVRLVSFNGIPAPLPEDEITALQTGLASGIKAAPDSFPALGSRVRVKGGPLSGLIGVLKRKKAKTWVVISIEMLRQSVAVDVVDADLEPAS